MTSGRGPFQSGVCAGLALGTMVGCRGWEASFSWAPSPGLQPLHSMKTPKFASRAPFAFNSLASPHLVCVPKSWGFHSHIQLLGWGAGWYADQVCLGPSLGSLLRGCKILATEVSVAARCQALGGAHCHPHEQPLVQVFLRPYSTGLHPGEGYTLQGFEPRPSGPRAEAFNHCAMDRKKDILSLLGPQVPKQCKAKTPTWL